MVSSTKEIIKFVVCADPNPDDGVAVALADGAILFINANRPDAVIATELFEAKRGMIWVLREEGVSAARGHAVRFAQMRISPPETGPGARIHRRLGSSGSSPSAAESRKKASRRGRA